MKRNNLLAICNPLWSCPKLIRRKMSGKREEKVHEARREKENEEEAKVRIGKKKDMKMMKEDKGKEDEKKKKEKEQ